MNNTLPGEGRHVMVTGGAGYIGSTITELLLARGYEVTILDRFFFGDTLADLRANPRLHLVKGDVRWAPKEVFNGVDSVVDMAAISNDPAGELIRDKTLEINHEGRARIARMAKEAGVGRYVVATSCSIYGFQDEVVDETSAKNPLTTYAEANGLVEESNLPLADDTFTTTALRQATVYGYSRRMRYDLAINGMSLSLAKTGKLTVMRDGAQWRPFVHVRDTCRAFIAVLEAEKAKVNGEIFNVGSADQNVTIKDLAERLSRAVGIEPEIEWYGDIDHRSYRVSFEKIQRVLGYRTEWTPETGAKEMYAKLKSGESTDEPRTKTVGWYKGLIDGLAAGNADAKEVAINGVIL